MVGHGTHNQPAGTWSDDTSMALALCDSYRELGWWDVEDVRSKFKAWFSHGAYTVDGLFDIGNATAQALRTGRGLSGEFDNGNGSLMRTIPLAFTDATDDEIRALSAITHAHSTSCNACVDMVRIARELIAGKPISDAVPHALQLTTTPRGDIRSSGYVLDALRAALWCLVNTSTYEECVLAAVNLGDDTDTTAAVAGALAGIVYGLKAIPSEWLDTLRGKDVIERCLF